MAWSMRTISLIVGCVVVAGCLAAIALLHHSGTRPSSVPSMPPPHGYVGSLSQADSADARTAAEVILAAYLRGDVHGVWVRLSSRAPDRRLGQSHFPRLFENVYATLKKRCADHWPPGDPVLKPAPKTTILNLAGLLAYLIPNVKAEMRAETWPLWHGGIAVFEYTFLGHPEILVMTKDNGEWKCLMGAMSSGPFDNKEDEAAWRQLVQGFREGKLDYLSELVWGSRS
jgi:hypothetical protein